MPGLAAKRSNKRTWLFAAGALVCVMGLQVADSFARGHAFLINRSPSLPHWAFFIEKGVQPDRGDIAFFRIPRNDLTERHFGKEAPPFGKIVYGIAGDVIERSGNAVYVRHQGRSGDTALQLVATLKPRAATGEVLAPGPVGVIPKGCYFMGSPHKDGFDSRYAAIGLVCARQVIGVAQRVFL